MEHRCLDSLSEESSTWPTITVLLIYFFIILTPAFSAIYYWQTTTWNFIAVGISGWLAIGVVVAALDARETAFTSVKQDWLDWIFIAIGWPFNLSHN